MQIIRKSLLAGYSFKLLGAKHSRPAAGRYYLHVSRVYGNPRKGFPQNQINQVRRDIDDTFALLLSVEKPSGPYQRLPRHVLEEVVHTFFGNSRFFYRARGQFAEQIGHLRQHSLHHGSNLEALGHDVVQQYPLLVGHLQCFLQQRIITWLNRHRLVSQHVESFGHGRSDVLGLLRIIARHDYYVARLFFEHLGHEVRAGVDFCLPVSRGFFARIVLFYASQVLLHVFSGGSVHVHDRIYRSVVIFLHQSGVKMSRIKGYKLHFIGRAGELVGRHG